MWSFMAKLMGKKEIHKEIIVNVESLETRVAVMEEGNLEEFYTSSARATSISWAASSRAGSRTSRTASRPPSWTSA